MKCHANELDQPLGISEGFTARSEHDKYRATCTASRLLLHVATLPVAGALEKKGPQAKSQKGGGTNSDSAFAQLIIAHGVEYIRDLKEEVTHALHGRTLSPHRSAGIGRVVDGRLSLSAQSIVNVDGDSAARR